MNVSSFLTKKIRFVVGSGGNENFFVLLSCFLVKKEDFVRRILSKKTSAGIIGYEIPCCSFGFGNSYF